MKQLQYAIAGLMIVAMVACVAVIVHAGNELNREVGPNAMTVAPDGRLYVVSHDKVHVFASEDRREKVLDLKAMGAPRIPSDIAVRSDGQLYLADQEGARLVACEIERARCGGQHLGLKSWTPEHLMPNNTFKFTLDEARGRIYFSDNGGNRMLITDADGRVLARSPGDRSMVWFPNQVASFVPGEMTVVDTNHKRVVTFDVAEDKVGRALREFSTSAPGIARDKREWPFAMARLPDASHWVAVAGDGMKDADVILYSPAGKPVQRVDLGPRSDPWAVAYWQGNVVVGDARNYRLHAFAPDGTKVREFRDPEFERELRELEVKALSWQQYRLYAIVGIVAFPLVAIGLLRGTGMPLVPPDRQPIPRPLHAEAPPDPRELQWIKAKPAYVEMMVKRHRMMGQVFLPATLGIGFALLLIIFPGLKTPALIAYGLAIGFVLVLAIVITIQARKGLREKLESIRLGVSQRGCHIVSPNMQTGKLEERGPFPWRDVYFDGRKLLAGQKAFLVKLPTGDEVFAREEFDREILARIPRANFVGQAGLAWREIKAATPFMKAMYAIALVLFIVVLFRALTRL